MDLSNRKPSTAIIAGALIAVAIIAIWISLQFMPRGTGGSISSAPVSATARANEAYFKQKAQECQGKLTLLSPQDQAEVIRRAGGQMNAVQALQRFYSAPTR